VLCVPALTEHGGGLDGLLVTLCGIWTEFETTVECSVFPTLRKKCVALDLQFAQWESCRATEFKPATVGHIKQDQYRTSVPAGYWPGRVDTYFDLYVAGVWNVLRAARLLLAHLTMKLSATMEGNIDRVDFQHSAHRTAQDMIASVPYHLTDNLQAFVNGQANTREIPEPGRHLGGLLLMHPLYVASNMPFLPEDMRQYLQDCLIWIGANMGIGQATLLAKVSAIR
jgi:hypothetical protein